jgi:hypothetical protein
MNFQITGKSNKICETDYFKSLLSGNIKLVSLIDVELLTRIFEISIAAYWLFCNIIL